MVFKPVKLILIFLLFLVSSINLTAYGTEEIIVMENIPKTIRIAVDLNMPPLQYKEYNKYLGFHIDVLEGIADFQNFKSQYVSMSLEKSIEALQKGEIDAILGVNYLTNLSEDLIFTESILASSVGLITSSSKIEEKDNLLELTDMTIALKRKTVEYQYLQNVRRVEYNSTSSQVDAFELLLMGRADSLMGDKIVFQYLLDKYNLTQEYQFVTSYIIPLEHSIAVHKDNYQLLYQLNNGLRQLKERGIYGEIYDTWFIHEDLLAQQRLEQVIKAFAFFALMSSIIFVLSIRWNKQLKKEVDKKTSQIQQTNADLQFQIGETKNKNELVNQILESSPRGMVALDKEGRIDSVNPRAVEMIGMDTNPIGKKFYKFPLFQEVLQDKIEDVLNNGMQFLSQEIKWKKQEENYSIRYMVYPLRNYEKVITGLMVSFEDYTAEKKLRAELFAREKSNALNEIVAGIAHEIRNPLTSIKTFVELIPEKFNNPNFHRDIISYVPKEVDRVNQLIESLIDYAKPKQPNKELIVVQNLIQSCCGLYKPIIEKKGFILDVQVEEDLKINADKGQMKQVMLNFIINGIEAMEELSAIGGIPQKLSVLGWSNDKTVYIEIVDEGIGMTEEEIKSALNPFYTTKVKGTGLGLTLSKQSIEDNGGQLIIKSNKNKGTRITMILERGE